MSEIEEGMRLDEKIEESELEQVPSNSVAAKKTGSIGVSILINLLVPLVNGLMLGFGEIFAHEIGAIFGWRQARVYDPRVRRDSRGRSWLWPLFA